MTSLDHSVLQNKDKFSNVLNFYLNKMKSITSSQYELFKTRLRSSLKNLSIQVKRERNEHEKSLFSKVTQLENIILSDVNEGDPKALKNMLASRRNKNNIKLLKIDKGEILTEQTQILNEFQKWYGKTLKEDLSDETTPEKIADIQSSYIEKHLYVPSRNSSDDNENKSERLLRCFIFIFSYFASSRYLIKINYSACRKNKSHGKLN